MSESLGKELLKTKTPNKTNLFSSEKLKRKINNDCNKSRKQRRENLFNKQRNGSSLDSLASLSTNLIPISSKNHQNVNISSDQISSNQISSDQILLRNSNILNVESTNPVEISCKNALIDERIDHFYFNLLSKYSEFQQTAIPTDLINYIKNENRNTFCICAVEFRFLAEKYEDLKKYLREGSFYDGDVNHQCDNKNLNHFQETAIKVIKLTHEILNCLIEFYKDVIDLKSIESFIDLMLIMNDEEVSNLDQESIHLFNLINFFSNHNLEANHIQIYCKFFKSINCCLDGIEGESKIWLYVTSRSFVSLLKQHTEFVCLLNFTDQLKSNEKSPFKCYLKLLFKLSIYPSRCLNFDTLNVEDDLYQLIKNLRKLLYTFDEPLISFVPMINNYFEPNVDNQVLDFLIPVSFIEHCCSLIEANINDTYKSNKLIEKIVCLFSNITVIDMFCRVLVDLKFIDHFRSLFAMKNRTVNYYLLIIIKNILSLDCVISGKFEQLTSKNSFDLIFTPIFVKELVNTIDTMNANCKNELLVILTDLFKYGKLNVIRLFISFKFFESLNNLMVKDADVNMTFCIIKILLSFLNEDQLSPEQLIKILNFCESAAIVDSVEQLCYSPNSQISNYANLFLEKFYNLSDLKENISPY